jgi:acyl carrier protein
MDELRSIFVRVLREPESKIVDTVSPKTLMSWNSLRHVELIMEIERSFGVIFSVAEIVALSSFAKIRETLQLKGALA